MTKHVPEMVSVSSSNVEAIGHHGDELHVRFRSGGHYVYAGVPRELHDQIVSADSVGRALNKHVVGKFEFSRR